MFVVDAGAIAFCGDRCAEGPAPVDDDHLIPQHPGKDRQHRHFLPTRYPTTRGKGRADLVLHLEFGEHIEAKLPVIEEGFHLDRHGRPIDRRSDHDRIGGEQIIRRHLTESFQQRLGAGNGLHAFDHRFGHAFGIAGERRREMGARLAIQHPTPRCW